MSKFGSEFGDVTTQKWREYDSWLDWLIHIKDPLQQMNEHWTYLGYEAYQVLFALILFGFALRKGGRLPFFWFAILIHGLVLEMVVYYDPNLDNFWQSQSVLMLFGQRYPVHILCLYVNFIFLATVVVSRMRLHWLLEGMCVGLFVLVIDIPHDITGIKLLWWSWHDTDPNIYDRTFSVPWTSYYFHVAFSMMMTYTFHGLHKLFTGCKKWQYSNFFAETLVMLLTGLLSFPLGSVLFLVWYNPMHDIMGIHTEVVCLTFIGACVLLVWRSDRRPAWPARSVDRLEPSGKRDWIDEIPILVVLHFLYYVFLVYAMPNPETIKVSGLYEPIGPCDARVDVQTVTSLIKLDKRKYLCLSDYDEPHFDFHCLPERSVVLDGKTTKTRLPWLAGERAPVNWYTMCGTPHANRAEFALAVVASAAFGIFIYVHTLMHSGSALFEEERSLLARCPVGKCLPKAETKPSPVGADAARRPVELSQSVEQSAKPPQQAQSGGNGPRKRKVKKQ